MHSEATERLSAAVSDVMRRLDQQQENPRRAYADCCDGKNRIGTLEAQAGQLVDTVSSTGTSGFVAGGGEAGNAPRLRIPDPAGWKVQIYNGKQESFHTWRNKFEEAIGGVWLLFDELLLHLREGKVVSDDKTHGEAMSSADFVVPPWSNSANWSFGLGVDPLKIVKLGNNCFLAAWKPLHKEYDPITADTRFQLIEAVFNMGAWTVKGMVHEYNAMREAKVRTEEPRRRCGGEVDINQPNRITEGMICSNLLSPSTKKFVMRDAEAGPED